ncbi:MAG: HPF/RaiA family ribosome-associated protein [Candidatus Tyrphobacter sp.]
MEIPVKITYRHLHPSEGLTRLIEREASKLSRFYDRIMTCEVLVEQEQRHIRHGAPFHVRIDIEVPGSELVIDTEPSLRVTPADDDAAVTRHKSAEIAAMYKDPALAVRDAFRRAKRRLQDHARRVR